MSTNYSASLGCAAGRLQIDVRLLPAKNVAPDLGRSLVEAAYVMAVEVLVSEPSLLARFLARLDAEFGIKLGKAVVL